MKGAVYIRTAARGSSGESPALALQRREVDDYAQSRGISVTGWYVEEGVGGHVSFAARPEGARLLQDAEGEAFDVVLVRRWDRLGRTRSVVAAAYHRLKALVVVVESVTEARVPTEEFERFLSLMEALERR